MALTLEQRNGFMRDGYVVVPSVIPKYAIDRALKTINRALGSREDGGGKVNLNVPLQFDPAIIGLFDRTPAYGILESLLGAGNMEPVESVQIALNFPGPEDGGKEYMGHLDGMLRAKDGTVENFTALVGVVLSDQAEDGCGNFGVWPGSHLKHEAYFKEHGPEVLLTEESFVSKYHSSNIDYGAPVQVKGKAGDLIIAHYQLLHTTTFNRSPNIRYNCYIRIDHQDTKKNWKAPMTDLWLHFPGLRP